MFQVLLLDNGDSDKVEVQEAKQINYEAVDLHQPKYPHRLHKETRHDLSQVLQYPHQRPGSHRRAMAKIPDTAFSR